MYVAHDDASNLKINSKNYRAPTKMYIGKNSEYAPTTVSIPPIRRGGAQSAMGVEFEDTESEHEEDNHSDDETDDSEDNE